MASAFDQCPSVYVCVYVNQPLVSWRQMKHCASIRGSQNTHYPPRLFLYSHLCLALPLPHRPPQPLFVTTAILKAIHAAPRLSSCIAAFSPAPRFLFFFFLKPFIRLEQTGVDGGRTGEVACCCALSLCQMDAAWRCREDGGFGCYER